MAEKLFKNVVFKHTNGPVIAIEKIEARVEKDRLIVPAKVYRKFSSCDACWRGMHYPMRVKS